MDLLLHYCFSLFMAKLKTTIKTTLVSLFFEWFEVTLTWGWFVVIHTKILLTQLGFLSAAVKLEDLRHWECFLNIHTRTPLFLLSKLRIIPSTQCSNFSPYFPRTEKFLIPNNRKPANSLVFQQRIPVLNLFRHWQLGS